MNVDEPTFITVLGLASLTASVMFYALGFFARQIPGVWNWAAGCLLVAFATLLDGPRFIDDWRLASILFNIPFSVGQAFLLAGTMQFCGRPHAARALWAFSALAVVSTIIFTFPFPEVKWRIGLLSGQQGVINLATAYVLWRYPDAFARRAFVGGSIVAILQASAAFAQGVLVAVSSGPVSYASPEVPVANIISWTGSMLNIVVGNWIMYLLIMLRLVANLKVAAEHDALTGLLNRRGIRLHIDALLRHRPSGHRTLGAMILDIDHFKAINDAHGHAAGDQVLKVMGEVLLKLNAPNVTPCRWGGEEFCLIAADCDRSMLIGLAEQIRAAFQRGTETMDTLTVGKTVSVGIALAKVDDDFEMSNLIALADAQLYLAKLGGRDRVAVAA